MSRNQYPEHLNPFAEDVKPKRKLKLSESFREFTKSVRQSFRIKKKPNANDTVEYRKPKEGGHSSKTGPIHRPRTEASIALPRSRFQDRLTLRHSHNKDFNPFEEDEKINNSIPPQPAMRRHRGKKKAPLPPKSISSQNVNESYDHANTSNWSLVSIDSDYTYSTDNSSNHGVKDEVSLSENITKEIVSINREIEKLNEDSNNNENCSSSTNNNPELVRQINNIPDLVVTCHNSDSDTDQKLDDDEENNNKNNTKEIESNSESNEEDVVVTDVTENLQNPENVSADGSDLPFQYNERKSIIIEGSIDHLDNLDRCVEKTLYITGSKEELDNCNNNDLKLEQDVTTGDSAHPEKHRKAKLSKDSLLGTTCSNE